MSGECNCKKFVIVDETGETYDVYAPTKECAALRYAEDSNRENDYYLMDSSVDILVEGTAYRIGAEPDVHYTANELNEQGGHTV